MSRVVTLPATWENALLHDDWSGLTAREARRCRFTLQSLAAEGLRVVDVAVDPATGEACEPQFTWAHEIYTRGSDGAPAGGEVLDFFAIAV
jgi:hypothetical protein